MRVRCVFFAAYREELGTDAIDVEVEEGATVADVVGVLRSRERAASVLPGKPAVAVNRMYASRDHVVSDGDEIAFLPPIAGG